MPQIPQSLIELVQRFERNIESYRSSAYNETQLRREFIDPFFEVLGWDVTNKQGYAEAYKDVIHEDAIKIGSATREMIGAYHIIVIVNRIYIGYSVSQGGGFVG